MAMVVALVIPNLMMRSKLSAVVEAAGLTPRYVRSVADIAGVAERAAADDDSLRGLIVDLNVIGDAEQMRAVVSAAGVEVKTLGFFSPVDGETGANGAAAGFHRVIPRSKIDSAVPLFLGELLDVVR